MNKSITEEAQSTYQWYLNSFRWLGLGLTAEQYEQMEKHLDGLQAILDAVPTRTETEKEQA